jgi:hypothetical protein
VGNQEEVQHWIDYFTASDACGAVTLTNDYSGLTDDCGATGAATVTFTATDCAGNTSSCTATFTVKDTVPPTLSGQQQVCVVEARGAYVCYSTEDFHDISASDTCGAADWRFESCMSTEADDACGAQDGFTPEDCKIIDGGNAVCVRAETASGRRVYRAWGIATDECGNETSREVVRIHVFPFDPPGHDCREAPPTCIQALQVELTAECMGGDAGRCFDTGPGGEAVDNGECDLVETFISSELDVPLATLCIDPDGAGDLPEYCDHFDVSCRTCLEPGDLGINGCMRILGIEHDGIMDVACGHDGSESCIREISFRVLPHDEDAACPVECRLGPDGSVDPQCLGTFTPLDPDEWPDDPEAGEFCITVAGTPYCGTFDVSCNGCLEVGDRSGCLVVEDIRTRDARITEACCASE